MPEYIVRWEIDVTAETPEDAAMQAANMIMDPETTATVFTVLDPTDDHLIATIDAAKEAGKQ